MPGVGPAVHGAELAVPGAGPAVPGAELAVTGAELTVPGAGSAVPCACAGPRDDKSAPTDRSVSVCCYCDTANKIYALHILSIAAISL